MSFMEGFSPPSPPRIFWNSRKRSAGGRRLENAMKENLSVVTNESKDLIKEENLTTVTNESKDSTMNDTEEDQTKEDPKAALSERRKALFEPLEPTMGRTAAEVLLPPPDFDSTTYPKGWLVGKRRKLVNVDVVESMRRIAVQEMNRKDREIDGLNEQLEEDSRCLEHLQLQLLQERSRRAEVERENAVLQDQISMLMSMLDDTQAADDEDIDVEDLPGDS